MHGSMGDKIVNAHYVALQLELATTLYSNIFSLLCGSTGRKIGFTALLTGVKS